MIGFIYSYKDPENKQYIGKQLEILKEEQEKMALTMLDKLFIQLFKNMDLRT